MANILGRVTIDQGDLYYVDAFPFEGAGNGTPGDPGDLAILNANGTGLMFIKTGVSDRDWRILGNIEPRSGFSIHEEFLSTSPDILFWGTHSWEAIKNGGGSNLTATPSSEVNSSRIGGVRLQLGTYVSLRLAAATWTLQNGCIQFETAIRIPTLSDATNKWSAYIGLHNVFDAIGLPSNGLFFEYDTGLSANFRARTVAGGVSTATTLSQTVVAGTWYNLQISLLTTGTVLFHIDGVLMATHTTNIPSGSSQQVLPIFKLDKNLGTGRNLDIDYVRITQLFNTLR